MLHVLIPSMQQAFIERHVSPGAVLSSKDAQVKDAPAFEKLQVDCRS